MRIFGKLFVFLGIVATFANADIQPPYGCAGRAIVGTYKTSGGDGGPAVGAQIFAAGATARDTAGNLYIVDSGNENVRKVDTHGIITTVAGNGIAATTGDGGLASHASLNNPHGIAVDRGGNVYISELTGNRIRKITPDGIITTFAGNGRAGFSGDGSAASKAMLWNPGGLAIDSQGNLYVSDMGNFRLRRIAPDGTITTVVGGSKGGPSDPDGAPATSVPYTGDVIAIAANGDLVIQLSGYMMIASVDSNGIVHDLTGPAPSVTALPSEGANARQVNMGAGAIATDADGNTFVASESSGGIWEIRTNGSLHQLAGLDFGFPGSLFVLPNGSVLATFYDVIYSISKSGQTVFAGATRQFNAGSSGPASAAQLKLIGGMAADKAGNLYISDKYSNLVVRVTPDGLIAPFAGTGGADYSGDGGPASQAQIGRPQSLAFDLFGNLYVAQNFGGTIVRKIAPDGTITHFAGNGHRPRFCELGCSASGKATDNSMAVSAIASDSKGQIYLLDFDAAAIWKVDLEGNISTFLWGAGELGGGSFLEVEAQIQIDGADNLYFVDGYGDVLVVSASGVQTTSQSFVGPGLALDPKGDLYMATGAGKLLARSTSGSIRTVWDLALSPSFLDPVFPIVLDPSGNLYFADQERTIVFEIPNATSCMGAQHPLVSGPAVYNAASYVTEEASGPPDYTVPAVAPGELVTFFGNYLGPTTPAGPSVVGNRFDTQAGGARVQFDGTSAPILYASQTQISAVVPYEIAGQAMTQVTIEFNGAVSDQVSETVVDAFPGIFTADSSGQGQAAALNADNTPNSPSHPAAKGSIITFFVTGAGVMTPPAADGVIAGATPPVPALPVSVFIDGEPAKVVYAGGAPLEINGVLQVNAVIPETASSGPHVSLGIQLGSQQSGYGSQSNVTIAVQ